MTFIDKPVTSTAPEWNADMDACPTGRKLLALNPGGVACFAVITKYNRQDFTHWCALPKLRR